MAYDGGIESVDVSEGMFDSLIHEFGLDGMVEMLGVHKDITAGRTALAIVDYPENDGQLKITEHDVTFSTDGKWGKLDFADARNVIVKFVDQHIGYAPIEGE